MVAVAMGGGVIVAAAWLVEEDACVALARHRRLAGDGAAGRLRSRRLARYPSGSRARASERGLELAALGAEQDVREQLLLEQRAEVLADLRSDLRHDESQ